MIDKLEGFGYEGKDVRCALLAGKINEIISALQECLPKEKKCYDHSKPNTENCQTCDRYAFYNQALADCRERMK